MTEEDGYIGTPSRMPAWPALDLQQLAHKSFLVGAGSQPSTITGTQDLLSLFGLVPLYETYVRPYIPNQNNAEGKDPAAAPAADQLAGSMTAATVVAADKDKAAGAGGEKERKEKRPKLPKTYAGIVADIPGRNTIKSQNLHLLKLVQDPAVQSRAPEPLDEGSIRDAFTLQKGAIPGFDGMLWETKEEGSKKKKKKKEKRQRDADAPGGPPGVDLAAGEKKAKKRKADGMGTGGVGTPA